ncbi:MAG: hypothetical protein GXO76_02305 [Calditrichaeota bacterium]|nr:hypothetical protein [Calditrichota bacterium]
MSIRLYNTLAKKKEKFVPQQEGKVRFYSCGSTVYDYIHVGNARGFVTFNVFRWYQM